MEQITVSLDSAFGYSAFVSKQILKQKALYKATASANLLFQKQGKIWGVGACESATVDSKVKQLKCF